MNKIECVIKLDEQSYNGFKNVYHAMCVKQDLTHCSDALIYTAEELALEVV